MSGRLYSHTDRVLTELDHALNTLAAPPQATRPRPPAAKSATLDDPGRQLSAALMRVNHSGEVAAQALYRGQAAVTSNERLREELLQAAAEEHDHLAWCAERTSELGQRTSALAPIWYAGSFFIGALAGLSGDRRSLGFLAETERQVAEHLEAHLTRLPDGDHASRVIVTQMRDDELSHRQRATELGGEELAKPVRRAMRMLARVMTMTSFKV